MPDDLFRDRDRKQGYAYNIGIIPTIRRRCKFTDWEERFLDGIVNCRNPTLKQMETLGTICSKGWDAPLPSIKDLIWRDDRPHLPSRLAWRMTEVSARSGVVYPNRKTMAELMSASVEDIKLALRTIVEQWKLFRWVPRKAAYVRVLGDGETSKQFKLRAQQTIDVAVGICWILRDLVEEVAKDDRTQFVRKPAPHSNEEFAKQLECHPRSVRRGLNFVLELGYFRRYNRGRWNSPLYVHFDWIDDEIFSDKYDLDDRTTDPTGIRYVPATVPKSVPADRVQGHDDRDIQRKSQNLRADKCREVRADKCREQADKCRKGMPNNRGVSTGYEAPI